MNTFGPIDTSIYKHANDRMILDLPNETEASISRTNASDLNLLLDLNLNTILSDLSLPNPIQPEAEQQLQTQVQQQQHQQPWLHQGLHIDASPNDNCMIYDGDRIVPQLDIFLPIDGVSAEVEFGLVDLPQNQFPIKSENNNVNDAATRQSVVEPTDDLFRLLATDNGNNINNVMLANSTTPTRQSVVEPTNELFRLLATDNGSIYSVPTVPNLDNVTITNADSKIDNNNNDDDDDKKPDSMNVDVDSNVPTDRSRSGSPDRSRSSSPNPSASPSFPQNSVKNERASPGFAGKRHLPVHHKPARGRGRKQQLENMSSEQLAEEAEERNAKNRQAAKDCRLRRRTREKQLKEHSGSLEKKFKDSQKQVARLQAQIRTLQKQRKTN